MTGLFGFGREPYGCLEARGNCYSVTLLPRSPFLIKIVAVSKKKNSLLERIPLKKYLQTGVKGNQQAELLQHFITTLFNC